MSEDLDRLISDLMTRVSDLENRVFRVPTLAGDPAPETKCNLWMLQDGRLRGRRPDGVIIEYAYSNHSHPNVTATATGGTGSTVVVPPPPVPTSRVWERGAAWSRSFNSGGVRSTPYLYYGNGDTFNGQQRSMVGFDSSAQSEIGGFHSVDRVQIRLSNIHTYPNAGLDLKISLHNQASAPGGYSQTHFDVIRVRVGKPSPDRWYDLPIWVGQALAQGHIRGFGLNQESNDRNLYGYAQGGDNPRMRVDYSKV